MDTRKRVRTFMTILLLGASILLVTQYEVIYFMDWHEEIWDVFIFLPIQFIWIRYGALYITNKLIK
jgi:hypothetical protein